MKSAQSFVDPKDGKKYLKEVADKYPLTFITSNTEKLREFKSIIAGSKLTEILSIKHSDVDLEEV